MSEQDETLEHLRAKLIADQQFTERAHAYRLHAMESFRQYGQNTVRALFILNGGGSVALLSLIGSLYTKDANTRFVANHLMESAANTLLYFGIGLVGAVFCSGIAYVNYQILASLERDPSETHSWITSGTPFTPRSIWHLRSLTWTANIAIAFAIGSLVGFFFGGYSFYQALHLLSRL